MNKNKSTMPANISSSTTNLSSRNMRKQKSDLQSSYKSTQADEKSKKQRTIKNTPKRKAIKMYSAQKESI